MGTSSSNKRPKFPYDITITIIIILLFPWTRKGYYPGDVKLCGKKYTTIIHQNISSCEFMFNFQNKMRFFVNLLKNLEGDLCSAVIGETII